MEKFKTFLNECKTLEKTLKEIKKELGNGAQIKDNVVFYAAASADKNILSFLNGNTKGQRVTPADIDGYKGELWSGQNISVKQIKDLNYELTITEK